MIKSLRKKFILVNMLLVFIVLAVVFSSICVTSYRQTVQDNERALRMSAGRNEMGRQPTLEFGQAPPKDFMASPVFIVTLTPDGSIDAIIEENVSVTDEDVPALVQEVLASGRSEGVLKAHSLRFFMGNERGQTTIAFMSTYQEAAQLRSTVMTCLFAMVAALFGFFLISLFFSRWALRPVELSWQQQRRFVADASHELKTPLTVILANLGILQSNREDTVDSQMKWISSTEAEARRMKQLVENMLFLAKSDDAVAPLVFQDVNLSDLLERDSLGFESVAYERELSIDTAIEKSITLCGDEAQLRQLFSILIDNAIKYSEPNGTVTLSLYKRQSRIYLLVNNKGVPLSPEALPHLFDRFYRADTARVSGGYGLGLSIAKSIVEQHKGKISVASSANDGTTVTVELRSSQHSPISQQSKRPGQHG